MENKQTSATNSTTISTNNNNTTTSGDTVLEPQEDKVNTENQQHQQHRPRDFRFYEDEYPKVGARVMFRFGKMEDEKLVRVTLPEYLDRPASILLKELTRAKRVRSYQKLCPTGQFSVGEVISTEHDGDYIFLTAKTLTKAEKDEYTEWYAKSRRLLSFMQKISQGCGRDLECICNEISWPLYARHWLCTEETVEDMYRLHPLDTLDHPEKLHVLCIEFEATDPNGTDCDDDNNNDKVDKINADVDDDNNDNDGAWDDIRKNSDSDASANANDASANANTLRMSSDSVQLLEEWHEAFFGKAVYTKVLRFGLMSYGIEGCEDVKRSLQQALESIQTHYPRVETDLGLRDLPIYELKIRSLDEKELGDAIEQTTARLSSSGLLFQVIK